MYTLQTTLQIISLIIRVKYHIIWLAQWDGIIKICYKNYSIIFAKKLKNMLQYDFNLRSWYIKIYLDSI